MIAIEPKEITRREDIVFSTVMHAIRTACVALDKAPEHGTIKLLVMVGQMSKTMTLSYPDIEENGNPLRKILGVIPLSESFKMTFRLIEGTPIDISKICPLNGAFMIKYNHKTKMINIGIGGIQFPKKIPHSKIGQTCTKFK